MEYPVQSVTRISVAFTNAAGAPTDPTSVTLRIVKPDRTETVIPNGSITKSGTGAYHYDYTIAAQGKHSYRWQGDGVVIAATASRDFYGV